MKPPPELFEKFGALFRYPDDGYVDRLRECREASRRVSPVAAAELEGVELALREMEGWEIEELYTRAFDMNPVCALEVGWHLYGEQYERGRFLVRMRELLAHLEIDEDEELPDHLSSMLFAMSRLERVDRKPFAARFLAPALRQMKEAVSGSPNPLAGLIAAVTSLAEIAAKGMPIAQIHKRADLVQLGRPGRAAGRRPTL